MARREINRDGWTVVGPRGRHAHWDRTKAAAISGYIERRGDGLGWGTLVARGYRLQPGKPWPPIDR